MPADDRKRTRGAINGGFYPKKEDWAAQYPAVVIGVDDMKRVTDACAKVLGEPMEIPGIGHMLQAK